MVKEIINNEQNQIKYLKKCQAIVALIRKNQRLMGINKLLLILCALPFLHVAGCLGQNKRIPTVSRAGAAGFVASCVMAAALGRREENLKQKLDEAQRGLCRS